MWIATIAVTLFFLDGVTSMFFQNRQTRAGCINGLTSSQAYDVVVRKGNMTQFYTDLNYILVPRVPGTPGIAAVRQFIVGRMSSLGWSVEQDSFFDTPPRRNPIQFTNIIATWNTAAPNRIVVACHYDSKSFRDFVFLGATDSAVPCALMLDSATKLQSFLAETNLQTRSDTTLQFIFFDGEEAFERWTATDSLYGSRHLATKWKSQADVNDATAINYLQNIEVFVLLDLIGTIDTNIRRTYGDVTANLYFNRLSAIESCLRTNRWLNNPYKVIFNRLRYSQTVQDDHIPFLQEGVQTLHLISTPFPSVWHQATDNLASLNPTLIKDFAAIIRLFLTSLLLQG